MNFDLGAGRFSGVLLSGGTASRMDGIDKSSLELGGRTFLEICLDALGDAEEVVVVGPPVPTTRPVTFTAEDPPFGGPAAGLLAGVDALLRPATSIGVLAVDMPHVSAATMQRLHTASRGRDGALLVDESGRRQLCGVLDAAALERVRPAREKQHGMSIRTLLADLDLAEIVGTGDEPRDIDTWTDLKDPDA